MNKQTMICSFILDDNNIKGGETMGLYIHALSDPDKVVGKKCIINIYEVDTLTGKKKETTSDDLLAKFETMIYGTQEKGFYFNTQETKRIDEFDKELPEPEDCKAPDGRMLPIPLSYKPPYFYLFLDAGNPTDSETHTILIQSETNEIELFTYEIGFTVELENKIIFDSRKIPAYVECSNLLVDNCVNATNFIIDNHFKHKDQHLCGTHYGAMFEYRFKNEEEFLKAIIKIDSIAGPKFKGSWDQPYKEIVDKHFEEYKLQMTDCIDFVIRVLELGFTKTTMLNEWLQCKKCLTGKISGQTLAKCLTNLGWVAIYYAPDSSNFYDKDPTKTHAFSYSDALEHQYGNKQINPIVPVYDLVVNYSPTLKDKDGNVVTNPTIAETDKIKQLMDLPFAFLLAKYGRHTALLIKGKVYEVHWMESCYSDKLFTTDRSFFYDHTDKTWDWMSGIIVTPKIFWKKETTTLISRN